MAQESESRPPAKPSGEATEKQLRMARDQGDALQRALEHMTGEVAEGMYHLRDGDEGGIPRPLMRIEPGTRLGVAAGPVEVEHCLRLPDEVIFVQLHLPLNSPSLHQIPSQLFLTSPITTSSRKTCEADKCRLGDQRDDPERLEELRLLQTG